MSGTAQEQEEGFAQQAADWYARLRREQLSELEEARFRAWLASSPARRHEFDALTALWDQLEGVAQSPEVLAIQRQIAKCAPPRASRRAVVGWALAAGVAGIAGFASWQWFGPTQSYATGIGELRSVSLSDGSVVTLDTSSRIDVRYSPGKRRIALVRGRASFEVAPNPDRPFIVKAGGGEVLALGTVFDVYQRTGDVVVTLIEGRVAVVPDAPGDGTALDLFSPAGAAGERPRTHRDAIVLVAGEQVSFGAQGRSLVRSSADLQRASAWRRRKLDFRETPLAEALAEANRYSRLKIELRAEHFADAPISSVFDAGRNEALASALGAYFELDVERAGEDLIILTPGAR